MNWVTNIFSNKNSSQRDNQHLKRVTLAILPFKNLSNDTLFDYFTDGIAEELINSLSALPELTIISRNSSKGFNKVQDLQEIVQNVTLGMVIQGNIMRSGDQMNLEVELVNYKDHQIIWSNNYATSVDETEDVIDNIIQQLLDLFDIPQPKQHSVKHYASNFEAYDLYLNGRYNFNHREEGLSIGADLFQQSINIDPTFAQSYAGLSQCYNLLGFYEIKSPLLVYPSAKEAALKALQLDHNSVEAHTSLAFTQMLYEWDWESAEQEFLQALALNPGYVTAHHWYAEFLMATGRFNEGIIQSRKAQQFDPLGLIISTLLGMAYFLSGDYDRSIAECKKTLHMAPEYLPVYIWLGLSYCKKQMFEKAIGLFEKGKALSTHNHTKMTTLLAYAYAASGRSEAAKLMRNELEFMEESGYVSAFEWARLAVGSGDEEMALKHLENAVEERSTWLAWINVDPTFDNLRSQPRFGEIISKMNFPN